MAAGRCPRAGRAVQGLVLQGREAAPRAHTRWSKPALACLLRRRPPRTGAAIAQAYAQEGATLVLVARSRKAGACAASCRSSVLLRTASLSPGFNLTWSLRLASPHQILYCCTGGCTPAAAAPTHCRGVYIGPDQLLLTPITAATAQSLEEVSEASWSVGASLCDVMECDLFNKEQAGGSITHPLMISGLQLAPPYCTA